MVSSTSAQVYSVGIYYSGFLLAGNQATYDGITATKVTPFQRDVNIDDGLLQAVNWLNTDNVDFACVYTDQPDKTGHR